MGAQKTFGNDGYVHYLDYGDCCMGYNHGSYVNMYQIVHFQYGSLLYFNYTSIRLLKGETSPTLRYYSHLWGFCLNE